MDNAAAPPSRPASTPPWTALGMLAVLSPVFGIAQSHFVLGEPLTPAVLASAACVITGACLTFWRPAPAPPA